MVSLFLISGHAACLRSAGIWPKNRRLKIKKRLRPRPNKTVYDYSLVDLDGKDVPLSTYKGKLLLIVNLASQSVYHDQIDALNELQKTYADQGLVVIGIPSADFGGEELKDSAALRKYYRETVHADFPVFACASLPEQRHSALSLPFRRQTESSRRRYSLELHEVPDRPRGQCRWPVYEAGEDPADLDFHVTIEKALAGKFKKKPAAKKERSLRR